MTKPKMRTELGERLWNINCEKNSTIQPLMNKMIDHICDFFSQEDISPEDGWGALMRVIAISAAETSTDGGETGFANLASDLMIVFIHTLGKGWRLANLPGKK